MKKEKNGRLEGRGRLYRADCKRVAEFVPRVERSSSYSFLRRSLAGFYEAKMVKLHFVHRASPGSLFHSALLSAFLSLILAERRWESSEFKMHL